MNNQVNFWIFKPNLLPTILIFSKLSGLELEEYDIDEIKYGINGTSQDRNIWYKKDLTDNKNLVIEFAVDDDDNDIIFLKVRFEALLKDKVDICADILQSFYLQDRNNYFKNVKF